MANCDHLPFFYWFPTVPPSSCHLLLQSPWWSKNAFPSSSDFSVVNRCQGGALPPVPRSPRPLSDVSPAAQTPVLVSLPLPQGTSGMTSTSPSYKATLTSTTRPRRGMWKWSCVCARRMAKCCLFGTPLWLWVTGPSSGASARKDLLLPFLILLSKCRVPSGVVLSSVIRTFRVWLAW